MKAQRVIGVDVGGTKILAGVVGAEGDLGERHESPTPTHSQDELLAALDRAVEELLRVADVDAVGFGLPSQIDQRVGRALASVNIPLAGIDFRDRMTARFGLPVGIDNDGNAAAIAEWRWGAGRGAHDLVMLTLGTGIGGGLILSGRPYRGSIGVGAELGHIIVEHDGPPCPCGGRGHLEAVASGRVADRIARELYGAQADAHELVRRAQAGEGPAREALAELGRKLGSGIGSLVNAFDPELVIVGGGFARAGDLLLDTARERLDDRDADAERALGLRTDSRADARAVVAHDHLERVRWAPDLDLERPLVASVRVQRDVVARLRRRRADVVDHAWRELEPVGDAAQGLPYDRDVVRAIRDANEIALNSLVDGIRPGWLSPDPTVPRQLRLIHGIAFA